MKKVLIINGHPDPGSFAVAITEAYKIGALQAGAEIKEIIVGKLDFNPILQFGYRKRTELEPDLLDAQQKILWAEHIVWIYPIWWGERPALLKGFIDRTFLPGFAFKYRENSVWWDKLLAGRSAHIIITLDQPAWYYWLVNGRPTFYSMKKMTLEFSGFKPVRTTTLGPMRNSTDTYREKWLRKIELMGKELR
ncbi:NAD(P)H-dependent oxidoreductase [Dyadobacter subterraneus]|uniref:NAD(P)H-dependent oxidoreductase n=1 Tax=Dyadobacter subterraneus TaxID=2773304 RepID=A0ABR9WMA7_9BACT|nr:NAD(P)H-dependent oxidoreductase [Dyadobacter subterraneus]MBE9465289.1 NAD(P)H-dependent oxidoreductase [Dyadobacter subterraneus]